MMFDEASGEPLDFSRHECREKARKLLRQNKPLLLVGSPMGMWDQLLQTGNPKLMRKEDWQSVYDRAREHAKFLFELYDL